MPYQYYGLIGFEQFMSTRDVALLFSLILPFLLVFAVVFAILNKSKILGSKAGVDTIVAAVVGLLALQWDFMPRFFAELFPRLGMGIGVLLALLILIGLFMHHGQNVWLIILGCIGFIVWLVVIIQTQTAFSFTSWTWWQQAKWPIVFLLVAIALIVFTSLSRPQAGAPAGP